MSGVGYTCKKEGVTAQPSLFDASFDASFILYRMFLKRVSHQHSAAFLHDYIHAVLYIFEEFISE